MLAADRRAVDSELQAQAVQIKNIEMENLDRYLQSIGTQASLITGFAVTIALSSDLISITNTCHPLIQLLHYGTIITCLSLEFYCVQNSTLVSVFGPTYALNGPRGSMHSAVKAMKEERMTILYAFGGGAIMFGANVIIVAWLIMRPFSAALSTLIVVITGYFISTSAFRIGKKFYLGENMGTDDIKKVKAGEYLNGVRVVETSRGIDERRIEKGLNVLRNNSGQSL
ncbi:hypothetical protein TrVE_jg11036 [Triparma verrucosa]|uniref:Uncharacterized protein n=2 Tax=Triparma TaxID=722752 RepID=A0A9W7BRQ1_9STRA|nr:hypothetical protein TrST_g1352 [Triparma strigata]GMI13234.1 hypothetical protein TrVE_jg11036 [Triparma verrucosa]